MNKATAGKIDKAKAMLADLVSVSQTRKGLEHLKPKLAKRLGLRAQSLLNALIDITQADTEHAASQTAAVA